MKNKKIKLLMLVSLFTLFGCEKSSSNIEYRSPSSGDKGSYSIIKHESLDDSKYSLLTNRIGKNDKYTDFTKITIDCSNHKYLVTAIGYEDGAEDTPNKELISVPKSSQKWTELINGSSKSDLVNFVCRHIAK